ncbi:hypothetical protein Pmani_021140 [Petrolisthes manimaculis]|uniref:Uncharacterized protein n=1 Tax=Petrolisthes manimaculis TaxID=1843537 RepID=A0AAE1U3J4_9EUCA|nr:hypothetical protein Pmani_021140 [Petrolisthes manimaculis]
MFIVCVDPSRYGGGRGLVQEGVSRLSLLLGTAGGGSRGGLVQEVPNSALYEHLPPPPPPKLTGTHAPVPDIDAHLRVHAPKSDLDAHLRSQSYPHLTSHGSVSDIDAHLRSLAASPQGYSHLASLGAGSQTTSHHLRTLASNPQTSHQLRSLATSGSPQPHPSHQSHHHVYPYYSSYYHYYYGYADSGYGGNGGTAGNPSMEHGSRIASTHTPSSSSSASSYLQTASYPLEVDLQAAAGSEFGPESASSSASSGTIRRPTEIDYPTSPNGNLQDYGLMSGLIPPGNPNDDTKHSLLYPSSLSSTLLPPTTSLPYTSVADYSQLEGDYSQGGLYDTPTASQEAHEYPTAPQEPLPTSHDDMTTTPHQEATQEPLSENEGDLIQEPH